MRLLIVSNRLPVSLTLKDGVYHHEKSAGGLVSGLTDYLASLKGSPSEVDEYLWIGWPGISVEKQHRKQVTEDLKSLNASPVYLSEKLMDNFYLGYCNKTIWPLFHYFPSFTVFNREYREQYELVNEIFRNELLKLIKPDDIIWVHDYHLMRLPELLRKEVPNPIGFFLHIPFPTYEVFRLLPDISRRGLLNGLLGADLIGFHTYDYSQYFLRCVLRILGMESHMGRIDISERAVKVDTFPMGVDYDKFNSFKPDDIENEAGNNQCIVLSVDRLDYSKGILNRLKGFELFLARNQHWHGKVYLSMVVVPSRTGVESYQEIKRSLDELVGNINGTYGNPEWTPVIYQYKSLPHDKLIAMFRKSHVALLTPLRDGMNLVAKEFIASRNDKKGVLILSEFTGASKELTESIIINPNNIEEIADAIKAGLEMPEDQQIKGNEAMQLRLKRYDVTRWANNFVGSLLNIRKISEHSFQNKYLRQEVLGDIKKAYDNASKKIIFVNYDGTLVPLSKDENKSVRPTNDLLDLLKKIKNDTSPDIVIISGRSKEELERWLGDLPVNLTAEHGSWIRDTRMRKWTQLKQLSGEWKKDIIPILENYTDRLPGAKIVEKDYSLSWNYHKADIEQASFIAKELNDHLINITANIDIQIFHGHKVIELSNSGINKGDLARHWLNNEEYDFILAIGAGWSDELLFLSLPENACSVKVGMTQSNARYLIKDHEEVIKLLKNLL